MPSPECLHEDQIMGQSRKIAGLEEQVKYKKEQIKELKDDLKDMDKKIDNIDKNVNKLILHSEANDAQLELRLKTNENEIANLKEELAKKEADEQKRFNNQLAVFAIICTVITIIVNIYFNVH